MRALLLDIPVVTLKPLEVIPNEEDDLNGVSAFNPAHVVGMVFYATRGMALGADTSEQWITNLRQHHVNRLKMVAIAHNFYVDADGRIFEGRGWDREGAHAGKVFTDLPHRNDNTIGVCYLGDPAMFTPQAARSCRWLIEEHVERYGPSRSAVVTQGDLKDDNFDNLYVVSVRTEDMFPDLKQWLQTGQIPPTAVRLGVDVQEENIDWDLLPSRQNEKDWLNDVLKTLPELKQGDRGLDVTKLQALLYAVGDHDDLLIDEIFGPTTRKAVLHWQAEHHLDPDGTVGIDTWTSLLTAGATSGDD